MGLIASLVVSVVATVGADNNFYEPQSWQAPTMEELQTCADMADGLNASFEYIRVNGLPRDWHTKYATCELVAVDGPAPANFSAPAAPIPLAF